MTSIRRLTSGISSAIARATSLEVSAPLPQKETAPVEPVRTGFSEESDFQPSVEEVDSLLSAHLPLLAGRPGEPTPEPLRSYTGASDFQARATRYGHLLGTHVPPPGTRSVPAQEAAGPSIRASSLLAEHLRHASVSGASREEAPGLAEPVDSFEPSRARGEDPGFIADLNDLPLPPAPEDLLSLLDASSPATDFTVDEADAAALLEDSEPLEEVEEALATPTAEAVHIPAERLHALSASESLDTAREVAASGSPEHQAQVATALYSRGQTASGADAATYQRAAALAAAGSPEATQALLSRVGDVSAFVRTVLQAGDTGATSP